MNGTMAITTGTATRRRHWAEGYIGQPWTEQMDCLYWFCRIQAEVFGRVLDSLPDRPLPRQVALARMVRRAVGGWGYRPVDRPSDGDAVILRQLEEAHHIGVAALVDGRMGVVHALEGARVVFSDAANLLLNGWRIVETLGWAGPDPAEADGSDERQHHP